MSFNFRVKYYNTFWLKRASTPLLTNDLGTRPIYCNVFPGFPWENNNDPDLAGKLINNWTVGQGDVSFFKSNVYNLPNDIYSTINGSNWVIEESRIKGGFNNNTVDFGVRAYLREDSNLAKKRNNALIYSGIFNSNTNVNNTNVFSIGEDITKAVDPHNGSIQLIYAMDNNLTIFQENKVSTALIDKDYIYSAEGQSISTQSNVVIGQVTPYTGEYGISRNPESFALFGFRRYFTDKDRNAVLRLSRDGITEISNYGMKDFFRDELSKMSETSVRYTSSDFEVKLNSLAGSNSVYHSDNSLGNYIVLNSTIDQENVIGGKLEINYNYPNGVWQDVGSTVKSTGEITLGTNTENVLFIDKIPLTPASFSSVYLRSYVFKKDEIKGGFDNYKDNYLVSLQRYSGSKTTDETSDYYNTLTFDETVQGWTTFYTFRPGLIFSLKNNFYTTKTNGVYRHYNPNVFYNSFYGADPVASSITFVFNGNPSISKNFKTINYEGTNGWRVDSFSSDETENLTSSSSAYGSGASPDETNPVLSFEEGGYIESGVQYRQGFYRKNNKYYANLVNNSQPSQGEVNFGPSITGIKGFFATVKMSTDNVTDVGGVKELFAASTEFVLSR